MGKASVKNEVSTSELHGLYSQVTTAQANGVNHPHRSAIRKAIQLLGLSLDGETPRE